MFFSAASNPMRHSTGKERDAETGLDYFGARYLSAAQGKFMSPDPLIASANLEDPQSWNRYVYARNNPLRFTDSEGLYASPEYECGDDSKACLKSEQRRILEKSQVSINGKELSGKALYQAMNEKEQNAFVNITDRLASVKFSDGSNALSMVQSINVNPETGKLNSDRIFATVATSLQGDVASSPEFTRVNAGDHGIYADSSFKDWDVTFGNVQFSFNKGKTGADIDMDIGNMTNGLIGAVTHIGEYLQNKIFGTTTNQDKIRKLLIHNPKVETITPSPVSKWNRQ
jgi:RHS repeat-associated protein